MRLLDLLREGLIKVGLEAQTKEAAVGELLDVLVRERELPRDLRDGVFRAVLDRERSMSTGMGHGVAIPHGVTGALEEVVAALGVSAAGVNFQSADGRPAQLIFLLVIPRNKLQVHVKTLAGIARLLNNEGLREGLKKARSPAEVYALIEREEGGDAAPLSL